MDFIELDGRKVPAVYLGDAVYALHDGYGCFLRVGDHRNEEGQIYLEPSVLTNLNNFNKQCNQLREDEKKESENLANTNDKREG